MSLFNGHGVTGTVQGQLWSPSIEVAFWNFHTNHPEVYAGLVRLAYQAINAGRERIGIKMLFEVLRWEWIITGLPDKFETRRLTYGRTRFTGRENMVALGTR